MNTTCCKHPYIAIHLGGWYIDKKYLKSTRDYINNCLKNMFKENFLEQEFQVLNHVTHSISIILMFIGRSR